VVITSAVTVILACLILFVYFLWIIATKFNQLLVLAAPLMLCVPPLIAAIQYRAVFRNNENAARHVGNYLFFAGGLLAIFFAMLTWIYAASGKEGDHPMVSILTTLTLASVYLLLCGVVNRRWAKQLQQGEMEDDSAE
jgi:hypothetical protein